MTAHVNGLQTRQEFPRDDDDPPPRGEIDGGPNDQVR